MKRSWASSRSRANGCLRRRSRPPSAAPCQDVVENGTARRVRGAFTGRTVPPLVMGGKTGTGDHRYADRVMARTATFVFFIGDRFFGTITAHVAGPEAAHYKFTSALPAQLLKSLAHIIQPLMDRPMATQTVDRSH